MQTSCYSSVSSLSFFVVILCHNLIRRGNRDSEWSTVSSGTVCLSGRVVRMLDLYSTGCGSNPGLPDVKACCYHACASVTKQYNLVPANWRWCLSAGEVTVGLSSHWPHVADINGSPPTGSRPRRGRWAPTYALLVEYGKLYLTFTWYWLTWIVLERAVKEIYCCRRHLFPLIFVMLFLCTFYYCHPNNVNSIVHPMHSCSVLWICATAFGFYSTGLFSRDFS